MPSLLHNEQDSTNKYKALAYLRALRPKQWTKNLIVFAAPLFAFSITPSSLLGSLLAFALFCLTSSSFYLINDIIDIESDRRHPVKCKRPIASGLVKIPAAIAMAVTFLGVALVVGWWESPGLGASILGYACVQVAYNLLLKHKVLADVIAIATGFILRAYGGAAATGVILSPWFLVCTAMLALFLGIEKRKAELRLSERKGSISRRVLHRYSLPLLIRMESVVTNGTITSYMLWSSGPVLKGASTAWMMATVPFVLYGIFRYQLLSEPEKINSDIHLEPSEKTERPEDILVNDKPLLISVVAWLFTTFTILFLTHNRLIS